MSKKNKKPIKKTPYDIRQNTAYFVKNRLPAFILAGMFIFWTIASIFGLIGYCRTKPKNTAMVTANAQTIEEIERRYWKVDLLELDDFCVYAEDYDAFISFVDSFSLIAYDSTIILKVGANQYNLRDSVYSIDIDIYPFNMEYSDVISATFTFSSVDITQNLDFNNYVPYQVEYSYYFNLDDDYNVVGCNVIFAEMQDYTRTINFAFNISVYSTIPGAIIGNFFELQEYTFSTPAYGVDIASATEITVLYNEVKGDYELGFSRGELKGYTEGKNDGYENGYAVGKADGLALADVATFEDLMSSVFDVPIRAFTSLFNFDILGVNMANFFLSILTLCIVLAVVKMLI